MTHQAIKEITDTLSVLSIAARMVRYYEKKNDYDKVALWEKTMQALTAFTEKLDIQMPHILEEMAAQSVTGNPKLIDFSKDLGVVTLLSLFDKRIKQRKLSPISDSTTLQEWIDKEMTYNKFCILHENLDRDNIRDQLDSPNNTVLTDLIGRMATYAHDLEEMLQKEMKLEHPDVDRLKTVVQSLHVWFDAKHQAGVKEFTAEEKEEYILQFEALTSFAAAAADFAEAQHLDMSPKAKNTALVSACDHLTLQNKYPQFTQQIDMLEKRISAVSMLEMLECDGSAQAPLLIEATLNSLETSAPERLVALHNIVSTFLDISSSGASAPQPEKRTNRTFSPEEAKIEIKRVLAVRKYKLTDVDIASVSAAVVSKSTEKMETLLKAFESFAKYYPSLPELQPIAQEVATRKHTFAMVTKVKAEEKFKEYEAKKSILAANNKTSLQTAIDALREAHQKNANIPLSFFGKDFSGLIIKGMDFSGFDVAECNFTKVSLENVCFKGTTGLTEKQLYSALNIGVATDLPKEIFDKVQIRNLNEAIELNIKHAQAYERLLGAKKPTSVSTADKRLLLARIGTEFHRFQKEHVKSQSTDIEDFYAEIEESLTFERWSDTQVKRKFDACIKGLTTEDVRKLAVGTYNSLLLNANALKKLLPEQEEKCSTYREQAHKGIEKHSKALLKEVLLDKKRSSQEKTEEVQGHITIVRTVSNEAGFPKEKAPAVDLEGLDLRGIELSDTKNLSLTGAKLDKEVLKKLAERPLLSPAKQKHTEIVYPKPLPNPDLRIAHTVSSMNAQNVHDLSEQLREAKTPAKKTEITKVYINHMHCLNGVAGRFNDKVDLRSVDLRQVPLEASDLKDVLVKIENLHPETKKSLQQEQKTPSCAAPCVVPNLGLEHIAKPEAELKQAWFGGLKELAKSVCKAAASFVQKLSFRSCMSAEKDSTTPQR